MKNILIIILLGLSISCSAQTTDILPGAAAWTNTYLPIKIWGITSDNHYWAAGLNNRYNTDGTPLEIEFVRIDMSTNTATYKILPGTKSSPSVVWASCFDSLGQFYLGLNSGNRTIWKFNLKDSIDAQDLGNGFLDGGSLSYSMGLGADNNMYFGGSSGGPFLSYYNPYTDSLYMYPEVQNVGVDYVFNVSGDSDYIYCQTGERDSINIWSVRKSDGYVKELLKDIASTRFEFWTSTSGHVYCKRHSDGVWFGLVNGDTIRNQNYGLTRNTYYEVNNPNTVTGPKVTTFYNKDLSTYQYSGAATGSVVINTENVRNPIKMIFYDYTDTNSLYFAGDYYGTFYRYSFSEDTSYPLGTTAYNVYSWWQINDSEFLFGNYPNGTVLRWNKDTSWTLQNLINNSITGGAEAYANPKIVVFFRSQTKAGFHHASDMLEDLHNTINVTGDVIRTSDSKTSIGTYNPVSGVIHGYDYNKISDSIGTWSLANWRQYVLMSTYNAYGGTHPKIYIYSSPDNIMTDSIDLGYGNYGSLYVWGDLLIGITPSRIYKYNLATRQLICHYDYTNNTIGSSYMLSDGRIMINTTNNLPKQFWNFVKINNSNAFTYWFEFNNKVYNTSGNYIQRISGLAVDKTTIPPVLKKIDYIKQQLGL